MDWKVLAIITPLAFVTYQTMSKTIPKTISTFLITSYAMLAGAIFMLILHVTLSDKKQLVVKPHYLFTALGIGLLIALGNFGIIKAYSLGAPQSLFSILFYVLLIIYSIIFGILIWNEKLHLIQVLGLVLALSGIFITFYFKK